MTQRTLKASEKHREKLAELESWIEQYQGDVDGGVLANETLSLMVSLYMDSAVRVPSVVYTANPLQRMDMVAGLLGVHLRCERLLRSHFKFPPLFQETAQ